MKKLLTFIVVAVLFSCNTTPSTEEKTRDPIPFAGVYVSPGSEDTVIKVPPSKDTTAIKVSRTTRTTTETSVAFAYTKIPVSGGTTTPPPVDTVVTNPPPPPPPPVTGFPAPNRAPDRYSGFEQAIPIVGGKAMMYSPFNSYVQQSPNITTNVSTVTDLKYAGNRSIKFTLKKTDALASSGPRAEITYPNQANNILEHTSVMMYLPSSWIKDPQPESLIQWHQSSSSGSPPLALYTQGGNWVIDWIPKFEGDEFTKTIAPVVTNKWVQWGFKIKWSTGSDGYVELYQDGKRVWTYNGPISYPNQTIYLKLGIYKWPWKISTNTTTDSRTFWADELITHYN